MSRAAGRDQKESKGGQKGTKDFKSKRGIDMSELVNFRYERPVAVQSTPRRSGRKSYNQDNAHHVSKAQFVQANFRFLLSPLTNPLDPCLYDPDVIVPWQYVSCVILPSKRHSYGHSVQHEQNWGSGSSPTITAADFESSESASEFEACPICLEDVQVPRITSCGHTFCYTCILRHLQSDLRNCDRCPICAVSLCLSDLKTVLHATDNLKHIFAPLGSTASAGRGVETRRHRAGSMDSTSSTTYTHSTDLLGQEVDFTLLQMTKGSIVPQRANSDGSVCTLTQSNNNNSHGDGSKLTLSSVLPDCTADCAVYNRLMYLTQEHMRRLFAHDRAVLQQFRQLCMPAPSNINNLHKGSTVNATDSNFPALGGNLWASKSTTSIANKPPINPTTSSIKPSAATVGDVEALPFIQLALERQQQLEKEFENKLTQKALVNSLMLDTSANANVNTATFNPAIETDNTITNKLHYHIYQHSAGNLVFMHPICAKCIVETSVHAGIDTSVRGDSTVHSMVSQRMSPRTQMQKKLAPHSVTKPSSTTVNNDLTAPSTTVNNVYTINNDTTLPTPIDKISVATPASPSSPTSPITPNTPNHTTTTETSLQLHLHTSLRARVIDAESVRVTPDTRARYNVLRHLPLHSEVLLLEIDLAGMVPQHILCKYSEELNKRALRRKERAKQEKREKRLEQDRSMAEALLAQEHHDYMMQIREMELLQLDELHHGPSVSEGTGSYGVSGSVMYGDNADTAMTMGRVEDGNNGRDGGDKGDERNDQDGGSSAPISEATNSIGAEKKVFSFANITQMGGNFPTLASSSTGSKKSIQTSSVSAWGQPQNKNNTTTTGLSATHKDSAVGKSGVQKDTWERGSTTPFTAEKSHSSSSSAWPSATSAGTVRECGNAGNNSGKKEKKTKIVLMSNNFRAGR